MELATGSSCPRENLPSAVSLQKFQGVPVVPNDRVFLRAFTQPVLMQQVASDRPVPADHDAKALLQRQVTTLLQETVDEGLGIAHRTVDDLYSSVADLDLLRRPLVHRQAAQQGIEQLGLDHAVLLRRRDLGQFVRPRPFGQAPAT